MNFRYTNLPALHVDDDWRIAIHESGHAITGAQNAFAFEYVEIGPNEHGEVRWIKNPIDDDDDEFTLQELRNWQTVYAAGAAAEHVVLGEIRRHAVRGDMICHLRVDLRRRHRPVDVFDSAIERAIGMLSKVDLERVACELTQKQRLDYESVCALIGVKPPWER